MIRIFNSFDTVFTNNGEAVIKPTLCLVTKEDNGDFYLELQCGLEYLDYVKAENIIVVPTPQGDQAFRIRTVDKTRSKITAKAYHIFYDSENYLIDDRFVVNKTCNDALDYLNDSTDNPSPFVTLSDVQGLNSYRCVRSSLFEAVNTILERWGGHLVRDNYNLQIRETIGQDNGVTIQYRKNLKEITVSEDWSEVCTKLLPVGKDGLTLDYMFSQTQYDIPYTKTVSFEQDIEEDNYESEEAYQEALVNDLTNQALKYLEVSQFPAITYTISANVDKLTDVGDIIKVYDERLNVTFTTAVLSFEYDCILDKYTQVTFGTAPKKLSNLIGGISSDISSAITENNYSMSVTLKDALDRAEETIFNALTSSYVIYQGNQILIVDSLPAETATNVIRINSGGIGFSNTGINGDFVTAWTIDGTFNAQAINVINFTADMISGGVLKLGSNLNQYGLLEIYNESNEIIAQLDKNGLKMYAQDESYILINSEIGFAGFDRLGNKTFWVDKDEFHQKKSVVEEEITLCNKLRFIPVEVYSGNVLVNDGIGLVSLY